MQELSRNLRAAALVFAGCVLLTAPLACTSADDKPAQPKGAQTKAVNPPADDHKEPATEEQTSVLADENTGESAPTATRDNPLPGDVPISKPARDDKTADESPADVKTDAAAGEGVRREFVAGVGRGDCNQLGGSPSRNNVPNAKNIPTEFDVGEFDESTHEWKPETSKNVKWIANLGSQTYGNPVVANGKVYVGTNNSAGYLARYPNSVDLGCLLCFRESDGKFLWQHSSEKLPTGRAHDWEYLGICCAPLVENDRLWFVTSRGQVACLDTEGFLDGENDGPFKGEPNENEDEADAVWYLDMMGELKTSQHNMCACSVTAVGDVLFVCTSNGIDEAHINIPSPKAPSFLALDKNTGEVLWQDNSPGEMILHGQWSSPAYGILGGVPQVIFAGGDGWLYAFRGDKWADGKPDLLWKFDCNPKDAKYAVRGKSTRNHIIGTPVIYDGLVYIAVGEDPEHGQGNGHLWCIDPTKRGDVSSELAFKLPDLEHPIPHTRRLQAVSKEEGEVARDNPNSAAVWHYVGFDQNGDGKLKFEEEMHRTCGTAAIKNNLLFIEDLSGLVHCLDAKTGRVHWTYDLMVEAWGSPLIVGDKVYVSDSEGKVVIFGLSADPNVATKEDPEDPTKRVPLYFTESGNSAIYTTPIVANNVLYIANQRQLFAISTGGKPPIEKTAAMP